MSQARLEAKKQKRADADRARTLAANKRHAKKANEARIAKQKRDEFLAGPREQIKPVLIPKQQMARVRMTRKPQELKSEDDMMALAAEVVSNNLRKDQIDINELASSIQETTDRQEECSES